MVNPSADDQVGVAVRTAPHLLAEKASWAHIRIMASVIFDGHAVIKRLTAAGMPEQQAEILAEEQVSLIGEHLATKADLKALEDRLTDRLTIRLGAMMAAGIASLQPLVRLL